MSTEVKNYEEIKSLISKGLIGLDNGDVRLLEIVRRLYPEAQFHKLDGHLVKIIWPKDVGFTKRRAG